MEGARLTAEDGLSGSELDSASADVDTGSTTDDAVDSADAVVDSEFIEEPPPLRAEEDSSPLLDESSWDEEMTAEEPEDGAPLAEYGLLRLLDWAHQGFEVAHPPDELDELDEPESW